MIAIQIRPLVTCRPWVPTRVKNPDRKPLRLGPKPSAISTWNSLISMPMKPAPNRKVMPSQPRTWFFLPLNNASMAKP
ncbi:hypothetical protein D3C84_1218980 [compost metagenome]